MWAANIWGVCVGWGVSVRPSGAGLGSMSGRECTFSYMYTCIGYKLPTSSPRTSAPLDKFPPDKFPYGQLSPGQVPLASKHLKRTTSPRTTSPRTSSPGQVPLWTSSPQGELVRGGTCLLAGPKDRTPGLPGSDKNQR